MRISDWSSDVCSSDLSGAAVNAGFIVSVLLHRLPGPRVSGAHPILPDNRNAASFFSSIYRPAKANPHGSYRQDCQMPVRHLAPVHCEVDRNSVVEGKSVSVRVDLGGRRILKTQTHGQTELERYTIQTRSQKY